MIPARPPECRCEYPATIIRNGSGHRDDCPCHAAFLKRFPAAETPAQKIARLESENATLRDDLRVATAVVSAADAEVARLRARVAELEVRPDA